jgi:hypothetical protein
MIKIGILSKAGRGGLQKVWMLFQSELTTIIEELNIELAG